MGDVLLHSINVWTEKIEYYLPRIRYSLGDEIHDEIEHLLQEIRTAAKMINEQEKQTLKYATGSFSAVSSATDSPEE